MTGPGLILDSNTLILIMTQQYYFKITPDGDVVGTIHAYEQSFYFMSLTLDTAVTTEGDKYKFNGHNRLAIKITN